MELKSWNPHHQLENLESSNRTFMELKFAQSSRNPKDDGF